MRSQMVWDICVRLPGTPRSAAACLAEFHVVVLWPKSIWRCLLKPVASSYSASIAVAPISPAIRERVATLLPTIPNYVWLAMILLTATLLSFSILLRSRGQFQTAQSRHVVTHSRLAQVESANEEVKQRTQQLRTNSRAAAQAAQAQLHYVKRNEVVIATP